MLSVKIWGQQQTFRRLGSEAARDATCRRGPTNDAEVGIVIPTAKKITLALDLDDEELPVERRVSRDDRRLASRRPDGVRMRVLKRAAHTHVPKYRCHWIRCSPRLVPTHPPSLLSNPIVGGS